MRICFLRTGQASLKADHIESFRVVPGVRVAALCDVDSEVLARNVKPFANRGEKLTTYVDYRKLLEDSSIDAVAIATPNHWHSLMAVWACQAGKDVYVEKPISHSTGRIPCSDANTASLVVPENV